MEIQKNPAEQASYRGKNQSNPPPGSSYCSSEKTTVIQVAGNFQDAAEKD